MTADEFLALPDDGRQQELVAGFVLSEPPPGFGHGEVQATMTCLLGEHVRSHGLGKVLTETGFILARDPDTVRAPDVAFVRADRLPGGRLSGYYAGAPDLAVEILSPGDRPGAIAARTADYLAAGARDLWLVDPEERSVTSLAPHAPAQTRGPDDDLDGGEVVPGFRIRVADLFQP